MPSLEYWAGFFDGEGCVYIHPGGNVRINVAQKNPEVLYLMTKDFGFGTVRNKGKRISEGYTWVSTKKAEVEKFLTSVLPFLIVKKKDAEIGLKASSLIRNNNLGCTPLSYDEMNGRMLLREQLKSCHPNRHEFSLYGKEVKIRTAIKEMYDYKCSSCGDDLRSESVKNHIISEGKLICRKCNARKSIAEIKPLTREQIEEALKTSNSVREAASKLGIAKSCLTEKRKLLGLPLHPHKSLRVINQRAGLL